jgi:hypothetical protein
MILLSRKNTKHFAGAELGSVRMLLEVWHDIKDIWSKFVWSVNK